MKCIACDDQFVTSKDNFCKDCLIEILENQLELTLMEIEDCNVAIHELIVEICYLQEEIKKRKDN